MNAIPQVWGLYRIHNAAEDSWYVGISSNLRARLHVHARNGVLDLGNGGSAELILAKPPSDDSVVLWGDLQKAEKLHIAELTARGYHVTNITGGGNGQPPRQRFNAQKQDHIKNLGLRSRNRTIVTEGSWFLCDPVTGKSIPGSSHPELNLSVTYWTPEGDWRLWLHPEGYICAVAPGEGPFNSTTETPISAKSLRAWFSAQHAGANLNEQIAAHGKTWALREDLIMKFRIPRTPLADDSGVPRLAPAALAAVTRRDVEHRRLPRELEERGYVVDPAKGKANSLNHVIYVTKPDSGGLFIKTEENRAAVRSEVLVSLLWYRLPWPGLGGRALTNSTEDVVRIPPLGGGGIVDRGSFHSVFGDRRDENRLTLRCKRPHVLKRVGLSDLRLRDDLDVVKFLLINAITGNTDRHRQNLHYGWDERLSPTQRGGFLLPVDHGRCIFNNVPSRSGTITGSPEEAVTGALGNPHQLLRPLAELAVWNFDRTAATAAKWLFRISEVLEAIKMDAEHLGYQKELAALSRRTEELGVDVEGFIDRCCQVVVA
ncbi:MAG: GIY-YIG nuclease family protein [Actinomycetes bacterium]